MLKLFNRLAWFASIGMTLAFFSLFGRSMFYIGMSFTTFIIAMIVATIFKNIFFSKRSISSALGDKSAQLDTAVNPEEEELNILETDIRNDGKEKLADIASPLSNTMAALAGGVKSETKETETLADIFSVDEKAEADKEMLNKSEEDIVIESEELELTGLKPAKDTSKNDDIIFDKVAAKNEGPNIIQSFFKENALAKIGGILLFLAVVFLLQLVYAKIGPIGKLMIGFAIGFIIFAVGLILDKKGHDKEARILLGVSILINYLVILSGRYLIGENILAGDSLLSEGITFFLLIINTIFAISVSIAFESKALLFFSFVVAYLNPFLIADKISLTIYTMLAYSLMVSLGGIFLSIYYSKRSQELAKSFLNISFIGANVLVLFAPFDFAWQWVLKLAVLVLLSMVCIYYSYKNKNNEVIAPYFIGSYIFFILLIAYGSLELGAAFSGLTSTFSILLFFVISLLASTFFFLQFAISSLFYLALLPLVLILALFGMDVFQVGDFVYVLVGVMLFYLLIFSSVLEKINSKMSYLFFSALAVFILFMSMIYNSISHIQIETSSSVQELGIIVSIFMFLFSAYYFSKRKGLEQLYSLSSLSTVFILYTVIERSGSLRVISIISIVIFMLMNMLWPLVNKQLMIRNTGNLVFGMVVGALFAVSELFYFWYGSSNQSTMHIGLSFVALAVVYFFVSYAMYEIINHYNRSLENDDEKVSIGDTVYSVIGISISVFSLAVVYIFSSHSEIISAVLLFESALLLYFYSRKQSFKIYLAGIILMFVGVSHLFGIIGSIHTREYLMLLPMSIILLSFAVSLKFLSFEKRQLRTFHDIVHVLGIIAIAGVIFMIVPTHSKGYLIFAYSLFALALSLLYSSVFSAQIKNIYVATLGILFFSHIVSLDSVFLRLENGDLAIFKVLQYMATIMFFVSIFIFNHVSKMFKLKDIVASQARIVLNFIFYFYLFIITTQYVHLLFGKTEFVITIYWGILALVFLTYGIQKDFVRIRTVGLYILSLAVLKTLVFDIWSGLDDAIMRVIALMVVGGIMISISVLYGRKYGGDLKGEFNFENLTKGGK